MPVAFARLRIAGFKSFAEPVSLEILPGLTGIVGPNGCGKSNVVEALRWCMGEGSARSLRGVEMDDLIFAGTLTRAPRNLAEVVLTLEQAAGLAPPPLHEQAELQVGRRIERGVGSAYRINGREARARDVQTLFADLGSGARSSAMISQGRVAAIVGARPEERRSVLEEAAGITGLHARRHEAELKLRATEANLLRAEDLRLQLEAAAKSLAGQAEQAARYRTVAEALRIGEAALLALLHARASRAATTTRAASAGAVLTRDRAEAALFDATAAEQATAAALQAPREADALARALLQRRRIEAEGAARDSDRARADSEAAERRLEQAREDLGAAEARQQDAAREVERLQTECAELDRAQAGLPERLRAAEQDLRDATTAIDAAEQAHRRDAALAASAATRHAEHHRDTEAADNRLARALGLLIEIERGQDQAAADLPDPALLPDLDAALDAAATALQHAERALDDAMSGRLEAARLADATRFAAEDAVRRHRVARQADTEAATRAERVATETATVQAKLVEADRNLVPEQEQNRMRARVLDAEQALALAAAALDEAETARSTAASARMDAGARAQEGARARDQAEAEARRAEIARARAATGHADSVRDHAAAIAAGLPDGTLDQAVSARVDADAALDAIGRALHAGETAHAEAEAGAATSADALGALRDIAARLAAETDGLAQALSAGTVHPDAAAAGSASVGELLQVPAGLELAVAAVLAEGLDAGCGPEASQRWMPLPALPGEPLPPGATALSALIATPAGLSGALDRVLNRAGLVDADARGDAMHRALRPGQCLVTRNGALWRWDGYRIDAFRPGAAAIRLQQRARYRETQARLADASDAIAPAVEALQHARGLCEQSAAALQSLRHDRRAAEQALADARDLESRLALADAQNRTRLQSAASLRARAEATLADADAARNNANAALAALPPPERLERHADETARDEAAAVEAERSRRLARAAADAALQRARADQAAMESRHAMHETARRALVPALARLRGDKAAAERTLEQARAALASTSPDLATQAAADANRSAQQADKTEHAARTLRDAARTTAAERQAERTHVVALLRDGQTRIASFDAQRIAAISERDAADAAVSALGDVAKTLPDPVPAAGAAARSELMVTAARERERDASRLAALLAAEAATLAARQPPVIAALADWSRRLENSRSALLDAARRLAEAEQDAGVCRIDPAQDAMRRDAIEAALFAAEAEQAAAALDLERAETAARRAQAVRQDAERALAAGREAALRAEAREHQARDDLARLLLDHPEPPATVPTDLSEATETVLRRRIRDLLRERDGMGPVNLRADLELAEADARMAVIVRERGEIETAIARLGGQIGQLNREGRERLLAVFEQVDRHFRSLFARMFNGGRAHLGMVGSDDPLQAGLEIYAQPPGKKLATLSLLSGGEQALTALSLVFAVFRCNPAPICVLDEVDAPLDDANVERFCALLGDMVRDTGTRFLVVTHHQLTMAHMDRLYGVTMQERGVSRVLSVDLAAASVLVD